MGAAWLWQGHSGVLGWVKARKVELSCLFWHFPQAQLPGVHQESTRETNAFLALLIPPCALKQRAFSPQRSCKKCSLTAASL